MKSLSNVTKQLTDSAGTVPGPTLTAEQSRFLSAQIRILIGAYRKGEAEDPEVYYAHIERILSAYPPEVVRQVTDPITTRPQRSCPTAAR